MIRSSECRRVRLLVLVAAGVLWLAPPAALAQTQLVVDRPGWSGVLLPGASGAVEQAPWALALNPAGLALGPSGFAYLREEGDQTSPTARRTDAFFLNTGGLVQGQGVSAGLGLGMEFLRPPDGGCSSDAPCVRRTSLALVGGTPAFAAALAYRWYASAQSDALDDLGRAELGLIWRPASWLSLGALGSTSVAGGSIEPASMLLSVGLRPFLGRYLTLAFDLAADEDTGFGGSRLSYLADVEVWDGLHVVGQIAHRAQPFSGDDRRLSVLVGLRVGFGHAQLAGAAGRPTEVGQWTGSFGLYVSPARGPSVFGPPSGAQVLDVREALRGPTPLERLLKAEEPLSPSTRLALRLQRLAQTPGTGVLVLEVGRLDGLGLGRIEELRALVGRVRASGRKVLIWLESGGDAEYYLAAAADRVYVAPQAFLLINGLSQDQFYLRDLLDKIGVNAEFVSVGAYKSAPETFTRSAPSEPSAEQTRSLLDDQFDRYVQAIAQARRLDPAQVREVLGRGLLTAEQAVEAGLFDGTSAGGRALEPLAAELAGRPVWFAPAGPEDEQPVDWGLEPAIALIEVAGNIVPGDGGAGQMAAANRIVEQIRRAASDSRYRAIVVRIDSPGGDVGASELIWQALAEAKRRKPVVASMGDVAASGGYYVAVAADYIIAEPSTLTGSIGVFAGKADLSGLFDKLGIGWATFRRGDRADLFSVARPWTDGERGQVQLVVDTFYGTFLDRVAAGRPLTRDEVQVVAQGRVWTGAQAKDRGLVDELGGLDAALREARRRAGLADQAPVAVLGTTGLFRLPSRPAPTGDEATEAVLRRVAGARLARAWLDASPVLDALHEGRPLALALDLPLAF